MTNLYEMNRSSALIADGKNHKTYFLEKYPYCSTNGLSWYMILDNFITKWRQKQVNINPSSVRLPVRRNMLSWFRPNYWPGREWPSCTNKLFGSLTIAALLAQWSPWQIWLIFNRGFNESSTFMYELSVRSVLPSFSPGRSFHISFTDKILFKIPSRNSQSFSIS